jgi:hypothetical protein
MNCDVDEYGLVNMDELMSRHYSKVDRVVEDDGSKKRKPSTLTRSKIMSPTGLSQIQDPWAHRSVLETAPIPNGWCTGRLKVKWAD